MPTAYNKEIRSRTVCLTVLVPHACYYAYFALHQNGSANTVSTEIPQLPRVCPRMLCPDSIVELPN